MILAQQVRRPLVGIALSIAVGLYVQRCMGGSPVILLGIAAFLLAFASWTVLRRQTDVLIYIVCGLLAATHSAIEEMPAFSRTALPVAEVNFHEQELTGTVEEEPSVSSADGTSSFLFQIFTARLSSMSKVCIFDSKARDFFIIRSASGADAAPVVKEIWLTTFSP